MHEPELDASYMARAIELARQREGFVEPNPMVGCVIVNDGQVVGEGVHFKWGGPHAEVAALASAGRRAAGGTLYVTLEPCCHYGKTPPCTDAIIAAKVRKVVPAQVDPFEQVAGQGIARLREAGIEVEVGLLGEAARELNAPFLKLIGTGRPWIIAKWAMTLDGKIATASGESKWISSEASRAIVHQLRGRMDAIVVGRGTAQADDPSLTARPSGPRRATRIVVDSQAQLALGSQLVLSARQVPVIVAVSAQAPHNRCYALTAAGCEVVVCGGASEAERLSWLLDELGRRRMTNVLVEGGGKLLGSLFDAHQIDEAHVFVAPKLVGGSTAPSPLAGHGIEQMQWALHLINPIVEKCGSDAYLHGRVQPDAAHGTSET